jgi:hypothetical protein
MSNLPELPELPTELISYLFNLDQGKHIDRVCVGCRQVTDQVIVSYSDLPVGRRRMLESIAGRIFDIVPGVRIFLGKPSVCRCGQLNK